MIKQVLRKPFVLWILPLSALLGLFLWGLNYTYPAIGHDYLYFFPHLLAGKWHFVRQGFLPFRFTPHFCGGLPQYGNPQDMYYSLPQLLTFVMDPWHAIQLSMVFALLVGYGGWYLFSRDVLRFSSLWAHLLSLIVIANGFYLLHMIVGHFTFHTVPLLGLLLWIIFQRTQDSRRSLFMRACCFALVSGYALYAGYPIVLLFAAMAVVFFVPIDLMIEKHNLGARLKTVSLRLTACGFVAALLGLSKFVAAYSFMRFFPNYPFDQLSPDTSTLLFMARAFWYIPQGWFLFAAAGVPWGPHEYSTFLSPVTLMGLICGVPLLVRERTVLRQRWRFFFGVGSYALLLLLFFTQLTKGQGLFSHALESLPIFGALHATTRFLYLFSLFFSAVSIWCITRWIPILQLQRWESAMVVTASALTVIAVPIAYQPLLSSAEILRNLHYENVRRDLQQSPFLRQPVSYVRHGILDLQHVMEGTTGVYCYEPLFGFRNEFQVTSLGEGPVDRVENGFFNLNNPACFQYPEENHCKPGDRIAVEDRENFENFRRGLPVTWKLSRAQIWSDRVSLATFIACLGIIAVAGVRRFSSRKKVLPHHE